MCGFVGIFTAEHAPAPAVSLSAARDSLRHRGPDDASDWRSPDGRFMAGFRRLSIIDIETGRQPLVDPDDRCVLLGNGEIYNYRELRAAHPEYPYRSKGDMEVVLALARKQRDDFMTTLNGMYSLALYQERPHRLQLVRDRFGIKPLYWADLRGRGIVFASEIKAIFKTGLIEAAVDETAVSRYLAHGYVPAPQTLFRGINKVPAAHCLTVETDGSTSLARYWEPKTDAALPREAPDIQRYLLDILEDSVRLQLRSDVPIGALLSGGIDSSLMVALAARHSQRPVNTFTVRFEGATVDETPLARMVAERYGTNHTELTVAAGDIVAYFPKLAWFLEEPLSDASVLPNYLIESALGSAVRVALNGTGGDELFAGYGRYFPLPVERRYLAIPPGVRTGLIEPVARRVDPMLAWKLERADLFERCRPAYQHAHATLFPPPMRHLIGNMLEAPEPAEIGAFKRFTALTGAPADTAALYADILTYLPEDLLHLLDRTSMAASVEGRVPYLDHRLVEAALSTPPHIRTAGGRQKALQRAMAAPLLPDAVVAAPKQGFASPVVAWFDAQLARSAELLLTDSRTLERGWWTPEGIRRLLAQTKRHAHRIYALMSLEMAVRLFVENEIADTPPDVPLGDYLDDR